MFYLYKDINNNYFYILRAILPRGMSELVISVGNKYALNRDLV